MTDNGRLSFARDEDIQFEPEAAEDIQLEDPGGDIELDEDDASPETQTVTTDGRVGSAGANPVGGPLPIVQVLPADFPLPALIQFVPDARLRIKADAAAAAALAVIVTGADGLQAADAALVTLRADLQAIEAHF